MQIKVGNKKLSFAAVKFFSEGKEELFFLKAVTKALLAILGIYTLLRVIFIILYNDILNVEGFSNWSKILLAGVRFDLSALIYINAPFMLMALIPLSIRQKPLYINLLRWSYLIPNLLFILLCIVDFGYYRHTQRRTSTELFGMLNDLPPQILSYLKGYWYLFIAFLMMIWLFKRITDKLIVAPVKSQLHPIFQYVILVFSSGLCVLAARGGTQLRPLAPINAADYVPTKQSAAVLNTPFVFLSSIFTNSVAFVHYMNDSVADQIVDPIKPPYPDSLFQKKNVIIFILESFNREWIGCLNGRTFYTPFLDSICAKSILCTNAYANAKHSNEGVPAIIASLPSLMDESILASSYQSDAFQGIGNLLKPFSYQTSFFHGARNGSFNFDGFAHSCGFDHYYGMTEFNDDSKFDGNWGIWDHEFLKFFTKKLDDTKEPFCSVFFNISSHYPFSLPEEYKTRYMDEPNVNHLPRTIQYVDTCLQQFFDVNKNKEWFKNTLFIFSADHTGEGNEPAYKTPIGIFRIPIIIYDPSNPTQRKINKPVMQIDILPTLADYLKIPSAQFSFGHSFLTQEVYPAYQYHESYYQVCDDSLLTIFNGNEVIALYNFKKDPLLEKNIVGLKQAPQIELAYLKAVLQTFRKRVKENKLTP